jgi:CRISPR/Cas system-associated exonuclease Cas4 (RecB family)
MVNTLHQLSIVPLKKISPTTFYKLQECKLNGILTENHFPALLPISPSARIGNVIHKLLNLASQGTIRDNAELDELWGRLVYRTETRMLQNQLEAHLVPLELSARNFEVKKIMAFKNVRNNFGKNMANNSIRRQSEKWLQNDEGTIVGIADIINETNGYVEIVDIKTGFITEQTENGAAVKSDYKLQLKMYAALYFLSKGCWPDKLIIEGLNNQRHEIPFEHNECLGIIDDAVKVLNEINYKIENESQIEDFANPSIESCKFCVYRPSCKSYWKKHDPFEGGSADFCGELKNKILLGNGYHKIILAYKDREISIRGLSDRHKFLEHDSNRVMLCNLSLDVLNDHFTENPLTTTYIL